MTAPSLREEFEKAFRSKFRPITQSDPGLINYTEGANAGALWAARWMAEKNLKWAEDNLIPHDCAKCANAIWKFRQMASEME